jgi:hypothetical protein
MPIILRCLFFAALFYVFTVCQQRLKTCKTSFFMGKNINQHELALIDVSVKTQYSRANTAQQKTGHFLSIFSAFRRLIEDYLRILTC